MNIIDKLEAGGGEPGTGEAVKRAAKSIGCEIAVLQAILNVESGGDAFDIRGRLIILPEKHVFWRHLPKKLRPKARALGLATPKWSRGNYKGLGGMGSDRRWERLRAMAGLHETAALNSASWGKAQIMGFNWKVCGYSDVTGFVLALAEAEDHQDEAFIAFLTGVGLAQDLRERDFRAVARRYNGSGQVARYAGMMEREYTKLAGRSPTVKSRMRRSGLRLGSKGYQVKALQERLCELGYHTGIDGDFGPATRRAVVSFQADHGLKADGIVGPATESALGKAVPIMIQGDDGRQSATVSDLKQRSQTARMADRLRKLAIAAGGGALAAEGSDLIDAAAPSMGVLRDISGVIGEAGELAAPVLDFIRDNPWLCVGIGAAIVWYFGNGILKRRMHDFKNWRHVG